MWKVGTWSAGKLKRQFFTTKAAAEKAFADAKKQRAELGAGYDVLTAREKSEVGRILLEITSAGMTLPQVWEIARHAPYTKRANCSLKAALDEMIKSKTHAGCSAKHLKNLEWYLGLFIAGRESRDITSIGEADLAAWFAGRKEAPRSKKQHMGLLSALFNHCWRRRYITENPVLRMEKVRVDQGIPSVLTTRQVARVIVWARRRKPDMLAWITLTLFCGLRPESEADYITWKDIDLPRKRLIIGRTKTRTPRIVDLAFCPPALAWLKVAHSMKSRLPLPNGTRRRYMRQLRDYLRMDDWPQDVMRHTAASNLLAHHQDAGKVAAFLGNSPGILLKSYKALIFKEDAARWMRLIPTSSPG